MIAHIVLFEPKPDLSDADRRELDEGLRAATREIPGIRRLRVGPRVTHGLPGYEQMMRDAYSFAAVIEFASIDDLRAYLVHPLHERLGRHFIASSVRALAYDYCLADAGDAMQP